MLLFKYSQDFLLNLSFKMQGSTYNFLTAAWYGSIFPKTSKLKLGDLNI